MTIPIRQATADQEIPLGYFLDNTDGDMEETGLTIANTDIKLWKMGATTLANKNSGGANHISNGIYYCVLDATDSSTPGALVIFIHVAGALANKVECIVYPADIFDPLFGTGNFQTDLSAAGVDAIWDEDLSTHTTSGTAGKVMSQIKKILDAIIAFVS